MSKDIEKRFDKLVNTHIRTFCDSSFKDNIQQKIILGEMPGYEEYQREDVEIKKLQNKNLEEMRPCYECPLLTFEQEQHLFKKMNYFKLKAKILREKLKNSFALSEPKVRKIEKYLEKSLQIRNQIAEANFRLVTTIINGCHIDFYRERNITDSLISDAYFDILKAVDYFDWRKGYKFSTYAIWVMKRNFFRDCKQKKSYAEKFINVEYEPTYEEDTQELEYKEKQQFVKNLITLITKKEKMKEQTIGRIIYILENYFGLNGFEGRTLENISEEIGVTKERVRQLKEEGLLLIKNKVEELGITYESAC